MARNLSRKLTEQLSPPHDTQQQQQLEIMIQICRAIGHILDPDELMQKVMQHVTEAFEANRSTLFLHDAEQGQLWSKVAQGLENWPKRLQIPNDHGLAGHVFQTQQSLLIADTFDSPHFNREVAEQTDYVPRSMIVVPVAHRPNDCSGVIQVMDQRVKRFTEHDLALLEAIAVQVGTSLENAQLHEAQKRQFHSFVRSLSAAVDARDPTTAIHSINVANYAMGIAHHMGLPPHELEWLCIAGMVHDVGKIGTPEAILCKDGKLTDDEFAEMKRHAAYSRKILAQIEFIDEYEDMAFIAAAHHEKLDGSGYPDGLRGTELPLKVRILAVADILHALTQDRQYRQGMPLDRAMGIIDSMTPEKLDANCVAALKRFLDITEPDYLPAA